MPVNIFLKTESLNLLKIFKKKGVSDDLKLLALFPEKKTVRTVIASQAENPERKAELTWTREKRNSLMTLNCLDSVKKMYTNAIIVLHKVSAKYFYIWHVFNLSQSFPVLPQLNHGNNCRRFRKKLFFLSLMWVSKKIVETRNKPSTDFSALQIFFLFLLLLKIYIKNGNINHKIVV